LATVAQVAAEEPETEPKSPQAGNPVEPGRQPAEHLLRQFGAKQNLAHPDEQRQSRQGPRRAVAPDRGCQYRARRDVAADEQHAGIAAGHQRDRDPHARAQQHGQQDQQDQRDGDQVHVTPRFGSG